jgi:hypothetical protein
MSVSERVIAQVNDRLQLVVTRFYETQYTAALYDGAWPQAKLLVTAVFSPTSARVDFGFNNDYHLILNGAVFELPFFELMKVADFLRLPFPLRHADQVPA